MRDGEDSPAIQPGHRQIQAPRYGQYPAAAHPQVPPQPVPGHDPYAPADAYHEPGPRRRLPDHAQDMLHQQEVEREMRMRDIAERRRSTMIRYCIEGMIIFTVAALFGGPVAWLIGATFGAGVGLLAWTRGGGYSLGWIGFVAYVLWFVFTPWGNFMGGFACVGLCAVLGAIHGLQKADGSEC